ncbi:MAG: hypothetical protein BroJett030_26270 [Alphaproteobacteria bacterium]|nr:MAG: hypothetical protein BroJett030_26270 [Alphaproteobacteria bacterium]
MNVARLTVATVMLIAPVPASADVAGKSLTVRGTIQSLLCQGSRCRLLRPEKVSGDMYVQSDGKVVFDYARTGARGDRYTVGRFSKEGAAFFVSGDTLTFVYKGEKGMTITYAYKAAGNKCQFSYRITFDDRTKRDTPKATRVNCTVTDGNIYASRN